MVQMFSDPVLELFKQGGQENHQTNFSLSFLMVGFLVFSSSLDILGEYFLRWKGVLGIGLFGGPDTFWV